MPLNWNASKCPAMQKVWDWDKQQGGFDTLTNGQIDERRDRFAVEFAILDDMIWSTIAVKIGRITEENAEDYALRLWTLMRMGDFSPVGYKKEDGSFLGRKDCASYEEVYDRVLSFIGLSTNVSDESRTAFWKSVRKTYEDDATFAHRRMMKNKSASEVTA